MAHKQILMRWRDSQFPNKNKQTNKTQDYGKMTYKHTQSWRDILYNFLTLELFYLSWNDLLIFKGTPSKPGC